MNKEKKKKNVAIDYEKYNNLELELKMMEAELYSMLISSSYPQVITKNKKNKKSQINIQQNKNIK